MPLATHAIESRQADIQIFKSDPSYAMGPHDSTSSFLAFQEGFQGGASVAVCDLDGNGYEEIVVGAGPGGGPQVRTFNSLGRAVFTPGFFAYDQEFKGGVNVACGDLDADGQAEIVTGPKSAGGSHIRIFNRYGQSVFTPGFFAYDSSIKGGVNIAIGDLDGGGFKEIITAPAFGVEPRVNVFNRYGNKLGYDIYPFHSEYSGGVSLAIANIDGGSEEELVMGVQNQDSAWVKVMKFGSEKTVVSNFLAFPDNFKGGVNIYGSDIDNDGFDEILTAANSGGGPHVKAYEGSGEELRFNVFAYEHDFRGGVNIAAGDIDRDGLNEIITAPSKSIDDGVVDFILVDLSEQKLYAYSNNILLKSFLVSTGLPGMDTRAGDFRISQKTYSKLYSGPDYYLPNTLWNMRFDQNRLLHGAYWHNNFGHRMSHGCINIAYPDAEWLYNATPMSTRVIVQQ
ncbi:L,D-transpeptidase family protein [Patescibacteria group bacterium]|nr:L,D-transpeptidase family protein [Patescibacteria group bacterium]